MKSQQLYTQLWKKQTNTSIKRCLQTIKAKDCMNYRNQDEQSECIPKRRTI